MRLFGTLRTHAVHRSFRIVLPYFVFPSFPQLRYTLLVVATYTVTYLHTAPHPDYHHYYPFTVIYHRWFPHSHRTFPCLQFTFTLVLRSLHLRCVMHVYGYVRLLLYYGDAFTCRTPFTCDFRFPAHTTALRFSVHTLRSPPTPAFFFFSHHRFAPPRRAAPHFYLLRCLLLHTRHTPHVPVTVTVVHHVYLPTFVRLYSAFRSVRCVLPLLPRFLVSTTPRYAGLPHLTVTVVRCSPCLPVSTRGPTLLTAIRRYVTTP